MPTKTLLTLEQFFAMPEDERGQDYELDRGELVPLPPQPLQHELIKNNVADALKPFLRGRGRALVEAGAIVDPESWRKPDVSVVWNEQIVNVSEPLAGTPAICIEVHSPSDSKRLLKRKVQHLLECGAAEVWVIYPDSREVQIVTRRSELWLGEDDEITSPELLPELRIPVLSLFTQAG